MKNKFYILFFVLFSCKNTDDIFSKIYTIAQNNHLLVLYEITDFDWDEVIICNPGTSSKDYFEIFNEAKIFDLQTVIIFRNNSQIVNYFSTNYHPEKPSLVEFIINTNTYRIFNREEAIFNVIKNEKYIILYPVEVIYE